MDQLIATQKRQVQPPAPAMGSDKGIPAIPTPEGSEHSAQSAWQATEHRPLEPSSAGPGYPRLAVQRQPSPASRRPASWASADRRPLQQRALQRKTEAASQATQPSPSSLEPLQLKADPSAPVQLAAVTKTGKAVEAHKNALKVGDEAAERQKLDAATDFESLANLLAGNPHFRQGELQSDAKTKVLNTISHSAHNRQGGGKEYWQGRYLWEMLDPDKGFEPSIISRIAMALGLFTHNSFTRWLARPGDPDEVRVLLESGQVTSDDAKYIKRNAEFTEALTKFERLSYRIEKLLDALLGYVGAKAEALEQINAGKGGAGQPDKATELSDDALATLPEAQKKALTDNAINFVGNLVNSYADKVGDATMQNKIKLFKELETWAASATQAERTAVLGSAMLTTELNSAFSYSYDIAYAKDILKRAKLVDEAFIRTSLSGNINPSGGSSAEDPHKERTRRVVKANFTPDSNGEYDLSGVNSEQVAEVLSILSVMEREKASADNSKFRKAREIGVAKLEESSDKAREMYFRTWAANQGVDLLALEKTNLASAHQERVRLLDVFRAQLTKKGGNGYGFEAANAEKFLSRLRTQGELGKIYRDLVQFLQGEPDFDDRLAGIIERLAPATPSDIVQIKGDAWLLQKTVDNIKTAQAPKNKAKHGAKATQVCNLLGLDPASVATLQVHVVASEAKQAQALMPITFAAGINAECENTFKNHGDIAGQMHRAYMASQDVANNATGDEAAKNKAQADFMLEVRALLSSRAQEWLSSRTSSEVSSQITWYSRLTSRGDDAPTTEWRVAVSTRGIRDNSKEVENTVDDLQGVHVLDISNFNEFEACWMPLNDLLLNEPADEPKDVHDQWVAQVEALYQAVDTFTFDLNPTVVGRIEAEHNRILTGGRTGKTFSLVAKARKKLADALAGDPAVQARFLKLGIGVTDFLMLQNRVKAFRALDEESLSNKGLQWDSVSSSSLLRKEAAWRLKGAFKEKTEQQAKLSRAYEKDKIKDQAKNQSEQEQAFEHTASVDDKIEEYDRRKQSFEAMRAKYNGRLMMVVGAILAVAFGAALSFATAGVASPFLVALISFGFSLAQKAITAGIEGAISGQGLNLTPDACWRLLIQTVIEGGIAMASAAITSQIKLAWDANIAGKDWEQLLKENKDFSALQNMADKGGQDWYDEGGFLKVQGLFAEAGKEAGVSFVKTALDGMGSAAITLFTAPEPIKSVKADLKATAQGVLISAGTSFASTLATAKLEEALVKKDIEGSEAQKEKRNEALDAYNADKSAENLATLNSEHTKFGSSVKELTKAKNAFSGVTGTVGTLTENVTETAMRGIPGLEEDEEPEELDIQMKQYEEMLQADSVAEQLVSLETALEKIAAMETLLGQPAVAGLKKEMLNSVKGITKVRVELQSSLAIANKEAQGGKAAGTLKSMVQAQQTVGQELLGSGRALIGKVAPAFKLPELADTVSTPVKKSIALRQTILPLTHYTYTSPQVKQQLASFLSETQPFQTDFDAYSAQSAQFNAHLLTLQNASSLAALVQSVDVFVTDLLKLQDTLAVKVRILTQSAKEATNLNAQIESKFNLSWYKYTRSRVAGQKSARAAQDDKIETQLKSVGELITTALSSGTDKSTEVVTRLAEIDALVAARKNL